MLSVFFRSIQGILVVIVMIGIGYVFAKKGWFDQDFTRIITKVVTNISLPAYMITTILNRFTPKSLINDVPKLIIPFLSMILLFGLSWIVIWILKIPNDYRGIFSSMFFNSNTVFIGLPVNVALFGDKSLPYVLIYYIANTTMFWTLGVWLIQRDGELYYKLSLKQLAGRIFSPPLLGFIIAVLLVFLPFDIFSYVPFLRHDLIYLGNMAIPLSMIFIGISISHIGLRQIRLDRKTLGVIFGRFVFSPLLMTILLTFTHLPIFVKQIFIIQSAMPVMTNAPIVAKMYGAKADFASILVAETTILSLIVIPILMILVEFIN